MKNDYDNKIKQLAEKIHHDKADRTESEQKSKDSFNEIKETIEAIQWILTETMRLTSDQQILTKKQQLKMKQLEKKHEDLVTDAEEGMNTEKKFYN